MSSPGLGIGILLACGLGQPSFTEAWYEEVILGRVESAFYQYHHIYRSESENSLELRRRAALRAAACAEKLGNPDEARRAYQWLIASGSPGNAATQKAVIRLRRLAPDRGENADSSATPAESLEAHFVHVEGLLGRRRRALRLAREALDRQKDLVERVYRITANLRRLGVEIYWPGVEVPTESEGKREPVAPVAAGGGGDSETTGDPRLWTDRFLRSLGLDGEDDTLLRERLGRGLYRRGLAALRAGDLHEAYHAFLIQCEILPEKEGENGDADVVQAEAFLNSMRRIFAAIGGLRRIAASLLPENAARRDAGIRAGMVEALRDAGERQLPEESGKALELLLRVQRQKDWAPVVHGDEGGLEEISVEADRQRRHILNTPAEEDLLRSRLREGKWLGGEISAVVEEILLPGPPPAAWTRPRLEDPERMVSRLRREVERVLDLVDTLPVNPAPDRVTPTTTPAVSPQILETLVSDTLTILEWFPELDPSGQHARRLERHRR